MKRPQITKHFFRALPGNPFHPEGAEFGAYSKTPEQGIHAMTGAEPEKFWAFTGRTETKEFKDTDLALAVCAALPGSWELEPVSDEYVDTNWYFKRADGLTLFFSRPGYSHKGKWSCGVSLPRDGGSYVEPRDDAGKIDVPSVGIGESKTPEQMAADIARRLIAGAERAHAACVAIIAGRRTREAARDQAIRDVCAALGTVATSHQGKLHTSGYGKSTSLAWESHDGGSVTFTVRGVSGPMIADVAKALQSIMVESK